MTIKVLKAALLAGFGSTHPLQIRAINRGWKPGSQMTPLASGEIEMVTHGEKRD